MDKAMEKTSRRRENRAVLEVIHHLSTGFHKVIHSKNPYAVRLRGPFPHYPHPYYYYYLYIYYYYCCWGLGGLTPFERRS